MRIAVTGHRPEKLPGKYDEVSHGFIKDWLRNEIVVAYKKDAELEAACGLAIGVDMYFAEACENIGVPFKAFIPFVGQENRWPRSMQRRYRSLLKRSYELEEAMGQFCLEAYFRRNDMILDWLDESADGRLLLAVWDGVNDGGTYYTFSRARERDIPIRFLHVGTA